MTRADMCTAIYLKRPCRARVEARRAANCRRCNGAFPRRTVVVEGSKPHGEVS
jgi:hypothetical protein